MTIKLCMMFVFSVLSVWLYFNILHFLYVKVKKHMFDWGSLRPSAYNGVFWVNSPLCCVVKLLLWPVCTLQTSADTKYRCPVVESQNMGALWLLCLSFAMLCIFLVHFTAFLTTWPRVERATFGLGLIGENLQRIYTRMVCRSVHGSDSDMEWKT